MSQIRCRAAVMYSPNTPLKIEEILVDPPKSGEVRVKLLASGVCHSDAHYLWGNRNEVAVPYGCPIIIGHEGAGVVESVAHDVTEVQVGDNVVLLWSPQCDKCLYCRSANPKVNTCVVAKQKENSWLMKDGTSRYHLAQNNDPILTPWTNCNLATFVEYAVVSETMVAKVSKGLPMDVICLFGCGITTGYGSAVNVAKVHADSACAVWGLGCVGLATIVGCKESGARIIIAVDTNSAKFDLARKLGCTHFINPRESNDQIECVIKDIVRNDGLDYAFDCIGNNNVISSALKCLSEFGSFISVGLVPVETSITIPVFSLLGGQTITGGLLGGYRAKTGVQYLVRKYETDPKFKDLIDTFASRRFKLHEINEAFDLMNRANEGVIRSVITMD